MKYNNIVLLALNCLVIIFLCSCNRKNFRDYEFINYYTDYEYIELNNEVDYSLALRSDTLDLCILNKSKNTIFLFDSYINDEELSEGILNSDVVYRYNTHNKVFKISFLPILPCLTYMKGDLIVLGPRRILSKWQIKYSFKPIKAHETYCFSLPFTARRENTWLEDLDVRDFNKWDLNRPRFEKSTQHISETDSIIFLEFAIFNDTTCLGFNNYYYNEFNFNNKIKTFKNLSIPLTKDIIEVIFRN